MPKKLKEILFFLCMTDKRKNKNVFLTYIYRTKGEIILLRFVEIFSAENYNNSLRFKSIKNITTTCVNKNQFSTVYSGRSNLLAQGRMYRVFRTRTWWLFLARVTTYPSEVIFKPQQRDTWNVPIFWKTLKKLTKKYPEIVRKQ